MPAICGITSKKCATQQAVSGCNGGRFGSQNGTYCNAKRAILESETSHIAVYFVRFYYQNHCFRVCNPCFLTIQSSLSYLVALFKSHIFLYNIVYKTMLYCPKPYADAHIGEKVSTSMRQPGDHPHNAISTERATLSGGVASPPYAAPQQHCLKKQGETFAHVGFVS